MPRTTTLVNRLQKGLVLAIIFGVLAATGAALAKKGGVEPAELPLCIDIVDGLDVVSDGAAYCNSKKDHVKAVLGDLNVHFTTNTGASAGRLMTFDLADTALDDSDPTPFPGDATAVTSKRATFRLRDEDGNALGLAAFRELGENEPKWMRLQIPFEVTGMDDRSWWLTFGNVPDTDFVSLTRTGSDVWEIEATDATGLLTIGPPVEELNGPPGDTIGSYAMSFKLLLTGQAK